MLDCYWILVNRLIDLESGDLLRGILREFLVTDLYLAYLLVGNVLLVDLDDSLVEILLCIINVVHSKCIEVGIYLGNDNLLLRIGLALAGIYNDLVYAVDTLDVGLDLFGIYVLSVREDNEVLESAGDTGLKGNL